MICRHCRSIMELVRAEHGRRSLLAQHRCPVCGSLHLSSELFPARPSPGAVSPTPSTLFTPVPRRAGFSTSQ